MSDFSQGQAFALTDYINRLTGSMGLVISENIGKSIALDAINTETVPIQDLLTEPPRALYATFSLSAPDTSDCLAIIPEECVQRFITLATGDLSETSIDSLNDSDLAQLNEVAASIARGFGMGLGNLINETIEIENCAIALGDLNLPPVYAMEEVAVRVNIGVSIPDYVDSAFYMMFTPQFVQTILPDEDSAEGMNAFLDEDSIAGMLSELESMGHASSTSNQGGGSQGGRGDLMSDGNIPRGVDLILDISLDVTVELGRVRMLIKDVLELAAGSIIELDRVAGEPVDVLVNGRLIAKGEVVVIEDNFGIRLTEIISPSERAVGLGRR